MNATHEEIFISRVVEARADAADWQALTELAQADAQVWKRLADAQRDQALLSRAVNEAVAVADSIELSAALVSSRSEAPAGAGTSVLRSLAHWGGWAAAAAVTLAWLIGLQTRPAPHRNPVQLPAQQDSTPTQDIRSQLASLPTPELLQAYVRNGQEQGHVIGELPDKVLIETRPIPGGNGYELLYVRQLLERTQVPDLYEFGAKDDRGQPALVRYDKGRSQSM